MSAADSAGSRQPRVSVVVPTHRRREVVAQSIAALAGQRFDGGFEVRVVVDGSRDGTAEALRALDVPFSLTVLEQPNRGAAAARNAGAAGARGELLLFLDDDMEADPELLAVHDRAHRETDAPIVVVGHIPLHPDSPRTFLSAGVGRWAEERRRELLEGDPENVDPMRLLSGQFSIDRAVYERLGGFDVRFNRDGTYGREDSDLGLRLGATGIRLVFREDAISLQRYVVRPLAYLRQYGQAGGAAVAFVRKHPAAGPRVFSERRPQRRWERLLYPLFGGAAARLVVAALATGRASARLERWFYRLSDLAFWRGVRRAGGVPARRPFRVLCFHALSDLRGEPVLEPYGIPPVELRRALRHLSRWGFRFLTPGELVRYVTAGAGVPRRSLLLTFDDAFRDLVEKGLPVLAEARAPAAVFAVSGLVGGTNAWDEAKGLRSLPLADEDGLRALAAAGLEIGAHARTHRSLDAVDAVELDGETAGAADDLVAMDLPRPRLFAYPFGVISQAARDVVARAGYAAAFTVTSGLVRPESDCFALPRIEIFRRDRGWRLVTKVILAGRAPWSALRASLRGLIRP